MYISTHSLLAKGDDVYEPSSVLGCISTHSLLAKGDVIDFDRGYDNYISTHSLLAKGDSKLAESTYAKLNNLHKIQKFI